MEMAQKTKGKSALGLCRASERKDASGDNRCAFKMDGSGANQIFTSQVAVQKLSYFFKI